MGLDLAALRKMQGGLKDKAGKGDGIFIYSNKLGADDDFRLLPTRDNMNGIYLLEENGWWINGKFFVVDENNDVIGEEIEMARNEENLDKRKVLIALIEKKKDGKPLVKTESRYLIPVLKLLCKYDDDELVSFEVEDDKAKILLAKPTLAMSINEIVTSRIYQNKTQWGMMDREKGFNIVLSKTGTGLKTEYGAIGWREALEMDEKYYAEDKLPDILEIHKKSIKSEDYLRSVIRHYLYGEDLMEEPTSSKESKADDAEPAKEEKKATAGTGIKRGAVAGGASKEKAAPKGRSLMDDVEKGLDDLDD